MSYSVCRSRFSAPFLVAALAVAGVSPVAAATPEQACQNGRFAAAARYDQCEQKATGKLLAGGDSTKYNTALSKCRLKYASTWAKLESQASGTGSSCDTPRYTVGAGTVIDNLTGLEWERKTNDATIHDRSNNYTWSAGVTAADGTVFTSFLATLNGGACFAGQCDWRLPTRAELQTVLSEPYPCTTNPCLDQGVFGPAFGADFWTSTPEAGNPAEVWRVFFFNGFVSTDPKSFGGFARAVRGGL